MMRAFALLVLAAAQTGASTGSIAGRVTDRESGRPLAGVTVTLGRPQSNDTGGRPVTTETGPDGRYEFTGLGSGPYSVTFAPPPHRASHLPHAYGERQPLKPRLRRPYPIFLKSGQRLGDADVALWRALAIGGRVTDESGEPMVNLDVHAFTTDGAQVSSADTTRASDDRGAFRIFGLRPGKYVVCAEPRSDWQQFWQPLHAGLPSAGVADSPERPIRTCHVSAASDLDAQPVALSTAEVENVEIRVRRSRTFTATGTIVTSSGTPLNELRPAVSVVRVERRRSSPTHVETAPGGRFTVRGLTPGDYLLRVDRYGDSPESADRETARVPFRVESSDVAGLTVAMQKPAKVVGRVLFEELPAARQLGTMYVQTRYTQAALRVLSEPSAGAEVKSDLSFELPGLFGPQVLAMRGLPRNYFVKSVRYRGRDITDTPVDFKSSGEPGTLEIVVSNRGTFLTGTVVDEQGGRADDAVVLVFAADRDRWNTAAAVASVLLVPPQGPYTIGPLRPGEYLVVAVPGDDAEAYSGEPDRLEALARVAERVVLGDNERRTLDLRVASR